MDDHSAHKHHAHHCHAAAQPASAAAGTVSAAQDWICPMHPQVVQRTPGFCPLCGMALEPRVPAEELERVEIDRVSDRFWICLALSVPVVALVMLVPYVGGHVYTVAAMR